MQSPEAHGFNWRNRLVIYLQFLSGAFRWMRGRFGGGINFIGDSKATVPHVPTLNIEADLTVMAWIRVPAGRFNGDIVNKGTSYKLSLENDKVVWQQGANVKLTEIEIPVDTWTHIAFVYNHNQSEAILYRNGQKEWAEDVPNLDLSNDDFTIGGNLQDLDIIMDELILLDRALATDEIKNAMQLGLRQWMFQ